MSLSRALSQSQPKKRPTQVSSFKPELEFEVLKLILLRERYLQRLLKLLKNRQASSTLSNAANVDMSIIGVCDVLRDTTVELIETIRLWEQAQVECEIQS